MRVEDSRLKTLKPKPRWDAGLGGEHTGFRILAFRAKALRFKSSGLGFVC